MTESNPMKPSSAARLQRWGWLLQLMTRAVTIVVVAVFILFLVGLVQRRGWLAGPSAGEASVSGTQASQQRYLCPMMCTPPQKAPGRCPVCGMELVPATNATRGDGVSVTIEPVARRMLGIRTAQAASEEVDLAIRTVGLIDFDESQLSTISAYVDGRLETLYANYVGVKVKEGDDLALIYSPQLYTAQTEYISSLSGGEKIGRFELDTTALASMARQNLSELGMTDEQIEELERTRRPMSRVRIKSPQRGTVIAKSAVEGDYVKTGQTIFRIADLSSVWLMLDLFPDDAAAVRFGQQVTAEIQSLPGEIFTGRVAFIDPLVNPQTRTVQVRVEIVNRDGKLRPGDYATATIRVPAIPRDRIYDPALANKFISPMHPQVIRDEAGACPHCDMPLVPTSELGFASEPLPPNEVVTVPREAVLLAGKESVVYVETSPGRFETRRVTLGPMTREKGVIAEGLAAGETVAVDGNFLIDSQMQLAGNPSLMDPGRASRYPSGPLLLPESDPVVLTGPNGELIDTVYSHYFEIQTVLASDELPQASQVTRLVEGLQRLSRVDEVPQDARRRFETAADSAAAMTGSLEDDRRAFRELSHAMLRAAMKVRGEATAARLQHYYCPMVPGKGGDWMQPEGKVLNPYWGSTMLRCGEVVRDLAVSSPQGSSQPGEP